jgi:hypothetical protein
MGESRSALVKIGWCPRELQTTRAALERYRVLNFRNVTYNRNEDKSQAPKRQFRIRNGSTVLQISATTVQRAGRSDYRGLYAIRHCGELCWNICSPATGFPALIPAEGGTIRT